MAEQSGGVQFNRPSLVAVLYLMTYFTGLTALVGVILAYMWRRWMSQPHFLFAFIGLYLLAVSCDLALPVVSGDMVQARLGWQSHPTIPGRFLQKLDLSLGTVEDWIGPLGLSAVTAYFGLRDIGSMKPNDRVLVSAAAGGLKS